MSDAEEKVEGGREREEGAQEGEEEGCTASSKVGKKPRKGLCLVHGPAGGRKLRVSLCPPTRLRDRWSFPTRQYMSRGARTSAAHGTSRAAAVAPQSFHIHTKTRVPRW